METRRLSLNGIWAFAPEAWVTMAPGNELIEDRNDLPAAGEMSIPGHWQGTALQSFDGRVRFTRTFSFDGQQDGETSVWLVFKGVDYFAHVRLNGQKVGDHAGYFQPFEFDVTDMLVAGQNEIEISVTCPREEPSTVWPDKKLLIKGILNHWDGRPGSWDLKTGQDQNSGGIWNDVYLEARPRAYVSHVKVTSKLVPQRAPEGMSHARIVAPDVPKQAIVLVDVEVSGPSGAYELRVTLGDEPPVAHTVRHAAGANRHTIVVPVPEPKLWWTWDLGEPHLESCRIELLQEGALIHEHSLTTGIREITFDPERGEWWLNGKRLFVRGTNVIPSLWLGQYSPELIAKDVALLRNAHINGVRVCVHINRDEFYEACDRAGILIWQDFALQWGYAETTDLMQEAVRQIRDMVRLLVNHPSIALWCCQNESTFHNKQILDPVLAAAVALEDGSRYIRPTSEYSEHTYVGWYAGQYRDYGTLPATPVLTEFGAQALPNLSLLSQITGDTWPPDWDTLAYHDFQYDQTFHVAGVEMGDSWSEFVDNSQAYQAKLLKFAIEHYRQAKYETLGGLFQFMFMDCWPSITWSVVDVERSPKRGYHTLQQVYQPVLIGCNLGRETILLEADRGGHARPLVVSPWVVNDQHRPLTDCTYRATVEGPGGRFEWHSTGRFEVGADTTLHAIPAMRCDLPEDLETGPYNLALELCEGNDAISRNTYDLEIVRIPAEREPAQAPEA